MKQLWSILIPLASLRAVVRFTIATDKERSLPHQQTSQELITQNLCLLAEAFGLSLMAPWLASRFPAPLAACPGSVINFMGTLAELSGIRLI